MQTDIPLKRLTMLCAADLLPLLGAPDAQVLAVETLELPASVTRLDNVLRLRSPQGLGSRQRRPIVPFVATNNTNVHE